MLRHSFVSPSRREGPPSIWDTHGISGSVFANPDASSSAPYPQELHQWNSSIEEPLHPSTVEKRVNGEHRVCKLGGIVGGDEGPIGGVAQVDCHGVKVVGEVKREVEENQGQTLIMDGMRMG